MLSTRSSQLNYIQCKIHFHCVLESQDEQSSRSSQLLLVVAALLEMGTDNGDEASSSQLLLMVEKQQQANGDDVAVVKRSIRVPEQSGQIPTAQCGYGLQRRGT